MSRSSLVWGPFSIVWGLAIAAATILLHKDRDKPDRYLFFVGTFWGGATSIYAASFPNSFLGVSFGTILVFRSIWADESICSIVFLGYRGRSVDQSTVSMCLWLDRKDSKTHRAYPDLVSDRFHVRQYAGVGGGSCKIQSCTAGERSDHVIDQLLDTYFDDARMERIYPNAKTKEEVGTPKEIPVSR